MGMPTRQQLEGVRERGEDGLEALDGSARRPGEIADERLPHRAAHAPGKHPERAVASVADAPHRLGQAGRLALDHDARPLGRAPPPAPPPGPAPRRSTTVRAPWGVRSRGPKPVPPVVTTSPANSAV